MRIALLCGWYYPHSTGGTEAYVRSLARRLKETGNAVQVVAPSPDEQELRYSDSGIPVYRYSIKPSPSRSAMRMGELPFSPASFESWLDEWKPDLLHIHSVTGTLGIHQVAAGKRRGIPVVMTVHVPGLTCPRGLPSMESINWPCSGERREK